MDLCKNCKNLVLMQSKTMYFAGCPYLYMFKNTFSNNPFPNIEDDLKITGCDAFEKKQFKEEDDMSKWKISIMLWNVIESSNGMSIAVAVNNEHAEQIVREHNAFGDLLEACENASQLLQSGINGTVDGAIEMCGKAIAKAKGNS